MCLLGFLTKTWKGLNKEIEKRTEKRSEDKAISTAVQSSADSGLRINPSFLTGELLFDNSSSLEHWFNTGD